MKQHANVIQLEQLILVNWIIFVIFVSVNFIYQELFLKHKYEN